MTVSKIRELMQERVIPESVLPQNIAAYLSDGDYLPPELDAFTFLNRLRSLGIGSADFLYLLKGCGAPGEAVEKIEQHPDMNLQSLIMTLDGSGLTSKDYTRMLYTARQLWEHTITMRLDMEEAQEKPEESPDRPEQISTARQIKPEPEREQPAPEQQNTAKIKTARQKKKNEPEFRVYAGVKPIGQRGQQDEPDDAPEVISDEPEKFTAIQLKPRPEKDDEQPVNESEDIEDVPANRKGAVIAAAAGAAVLCALSAGMELLGFAAPESGGSGVHFAENCTEIFAEISTAYQAKKVGGGNVQPLAIGEQVFGELLISSDGGLGTFSSVDALWTADSDRVTVYSLSGDAATICAEVLPPEGAEFLTVYRTESGITAVFSGENGCGITGIDSTGQSFLTEQSGALTDYFFDGENIRLGSVYTPVYTRSFTADDTSEYLPWVSVNGAVSTLEPSEIAVTGTAQGCSYAVWGEYSAACGEPAHKTAALGDPVYSGAEQFAAVLRQEAGALLVSSDGEQLLFEDIGTTCAAAVGNGIFATAEQSESGMAVYLRGKDMKPLSAFSTGSEIKSLRIGDGVIYVHDGEKTVMAADISSPDSPVPLELAAAQGVVCGEYALCCGRTASGITLTLLRLADGKAVQTDIYAKSLSPSELESFRFCGVNTMVINGAEQSGAAYRWFDGVSVVDEFAQLGKSRSVKTLYDDRSGFTAASVVDGKITLFSGEKIIR